MKRDGGFRDHPDRPPAPSPRRELSDILARGTEGSPAALPAVLVMQRRPCARREVGQVHAENREAKRVAERMFGEPFGAHAVVEDLVGGGRRPTRPFTYSLPRRCGFGAGRATRREPLSGAALAAVAVSAFVPGCACAPSEGGGGPAPVQCLTHGFEIMPLCGPARGVSCRVAASNTGAIPAGRASGFVSAVSGCAAAEGLGRSLASPASFLVVAMCAPTAFHRFIIA